MHFLFVLVVPAWVGPMADDASRGYIVVLLEEYILCCIINRRYKYCTHHIAYLSCRSYGHLIIGLLPFSRSFQGLIYLIRLLSSSLAHDLCLVVEGGVVGGVKAGHTGRKMRRGDSPVCDLQALRGC